MGLLGIITSAFRTPAKRKREPSYLDNSWACLELAAEMASPGQPERFALLKDGASHGLFDTHDEAFARGLEMFAKDFFVMPVSPWWPAPPTSVRQELEAKLVSLSIDPRRPIALFVDLFPSRRAAFASIAGKIDLNRQAWSRFTTIALRRAAPSR